MTSMEPKHHFSLWYFILVMMALFPIQSLWLTPHVLTLAYSDFQSLLQEGKIKEVSIAEDQPGREFALLYDVSHNTCKVERHQVDGRERQLPVHRKGATRAFGPGDADLPAAFRAAGQPVLIGGNMGTCSYILAGTTSREDRAFSSAVHGAGRAMSRHQAMRHWMGRPRGVAEEAPGAYKDAEVVVGAAEHPQLARHRPAGPGHLREGLRQPTNTRHETSKSLLWRR